MYGLCGLKRENLAVKISLTNCCSMFSQHSAATYIIYLIVVVYDRAHHLGALY